MSETPPPMPLSAGAQMSCAEVRPYLSAYVDGELAEPLRAQVARHLAGCAECAARAESYQATDALLESAPGVAPSAQAQEAARLLRTAPGKTAAPEKLPALGPMAYVYLYVGAPERALESYEVDVQAGNGTAFAYPMWHPGYAALRKTERFKKFVRDKGLVDYWKARGWPEFCHPTTGADFACS